MLSYCGIDYDFKEDGETVDWFEKVISVEGQSSYFN